MDEIHRLSPTAVNLSRRRHRRDDQESGLAADQLTLTSGRCQLNYLRTSRRNVYNPRLDLFARSSSARRSSFPLPSLTSPCLTTLTPSNRFGVVAPFFLILRSVAQLLLYELARGSTTNPPSTKYSPDTKDAPLASPVGIESGSSWRCGWGGLDDTPCTLSEAS